MKKNRAGNIFACKIKFNSLWKKKKKNKVKKVTVWNKNSTGLLERFQEQNKHFYSRKE